MKGLENYRVYTGKTFDIEFYFTKQGKMPGFDYYQELAEDARRRFFVVIGHFADAPFGAVFPKTILNIEDKSEGIYAFKPFIHRFFCFFSKDRKIIILNAYQKHSQSMSKADKSLLKKAVRLKQDYEIRIAKGNYYYE